MKKKKKGSGASQDKLKSKSIKKKGVLAEPMG